jgi:hypothetical protein
LFRFVSCSLRYVVTFARCYRCCCCTFHARCLFRLVCRCFRWVRFPLFCVVVVRCCLPSVTLFRVRVLLPVTLFVCSFRSGFVRSLLTLLLLRLVRSVGWLVCG